MHRFLESKDPAEQMIMMHIATRVLELRLIDRRNLATEIANRVWSGIRKKG